MKKKVEVAAPTKSLKVLLIVFSMITAAAIFFTFNSPTPKMLNIKQAMIVPTNDSECMDPVPEINRDYGNTVSGMKVHWNGCVVYVTGKFGAAMFDSSPDKKTFIITRVLIPVDVTSEQQRVIWEKEVSGNAFAILYGPDISDKAEESIVRDGLAVLILPEKDQAILELTYPRMNKIFNGQYVKWGFNENTTITSINCLVALAIHYTSLQGSILSGGISHLFASNQPFSICNSYLLNP